MSSENHLTIRDYFNRLKANGNRLRKASFASRTNSDRNAQFAQIFKTFRSERWPERMKEIETKSKGLTAIDYLANPFRAENRFNTRLRPVSSERQITAEKTERFNAQTASAGIQTAGFSMRAPLGQMNADLKALIPPDSKSYQGSGGSPAVAKINRSVQKAAERYNLPPELIKAVIKAESNFQVDAISTAGAQGLMQLMPQTARELGVKNPFDIDQNIDGGVRYLRKMLDSFGGNIKLALAAYNAGPAALEKYGGEIPPYEETNRYIHRVLKFFKQMV
jgi:soluble lytic murein transglycosylase-like protein